MASLGSSTLFTLFLLGTQFMISATAGPTLAPPSTFDNPTSTIPTAVTGSASASSHVSGSSTQTSSTAFPSLAPYSPCITNCLALGSSSANCSSVVDVNCYCKNNTFTDSIVRCISRDCPDTQSLSTAESLAQQFCNLADRSTSLSFPSTSFSPSSRPPTSSPSTVIFPTPTTSSAPTETPSSAAMLNARMPHDIMGLQGLYAMVLALVVSAYII